MTPKINYPQVSIVINTHNRCNILKHCLDSVIAQDYFKRLLELIVLDNASIDSTPEEIPKYFERLKTQGFKRTYFFRNEQNLNIATGRWMLGQKISSDSEFIICSVF